MIISIKNHIILLLVVFTLLPFVLLRIVAYPIIQNDLKTVIMEDLETTGHKQAELVSSWMRDRQKDALVVASNPYMADSVKVKKKDKEYQGFLRYLEAVVAEYGYMGAYVCNKEGLVTVSTHKENVGSNIAEADYFNDAIKGKTVTTDVVPSEIPLLNEFGDLETGLPTMFVATPLVNRAGDIIGVFTFRIHLGLLSNLILSNKFGQTGETYLVNKDGYMLTESRFTEHLKKKEIIQKRSALELKVIDPEKGELTAGIKQCITAKNGSDANGYNDYCGIKVLGVWRWMPEYSWGVITEIDKTEVYGVAYNLNTLGKVLIFGMVFPILYIAYFVGKRFSTPIVELTEATEKMASGDLTQRVNIKRNNEIGVLATSINKMAKSLEKKTRETAESEKRFRELFNNMNEGIYQSELGVEGVFTWVNQACAEMFGYQSPEEMIGTKVRDIYVDPDDRGKLVEKLEKEGISINFESLCKKKNGAHFFVERAVSLIKNEEGESVRIEGIIRDTTERKKMEDELRASEEHKRLLLNSLQEGVYQSEPGVEGTFTWVNQTCAEMFGYRSPEEMIGTKVRDIYVDPDDRRKLVEKLEKEEFCRNFESFCKKKNGTHFFIERTVSMLRNEEGQPVRIEGIIRDTTERKIQDVGREKSDK